LGHYGRVDSLKSSNGSDVCDEQFKVFRAFVLNGMDVNAGRTGRWENRFADWLEFDQFNVQGSACQ
jgi:hypothetical protein